MTLMKRDILRHIADALNPDEIIDRLGLNSEEVCQHLSRLIMNSLESFDDIYSPDEETEDDGGDEYEYVE